MAKLKWEIAEVIISTMAKASESERRELAKDAAQKTYALVKSTTNGIDNKAARIGVDWLGDYVAEYRIAEQSDG